ncbi:glutathione synthetase [Salpingoeca rosetta]|uniref:Glutathione synthetase n=1 Tax=Salpingoeca rosetta (strain ATCC 50818 / BSB-021) TaxID=946362 RepID=F2TVR1_SALR5|nr:glutathione synthetase [Salpingoeca rosetta]EGD72157.1 glutathione synthetase [Salpingoeca rosetta]|eukprot:XP_004998729.1 glutathione synthetase [Salpingoeca rosetta]
MAETKAVVVEDGATPVALCEEGRVGRAVQERLLVEAGDYAVTHGLMIAPKDNAGRHGRARRYAVAPCSLVPTAFPRAAFELGRASQRAWLDLLDAVARDRDFLTTSLASTCTVDEFTANLMSVYDAAYAAKPQAYTEGTVFAIVRNDYMLHQPEGRAFKDCGIRHVEANTIAASLGALSTIISRMHRTLLQRVLRVPASVLDSHMPPIHVTSSLADGFKAAHDHYVADHRTDGKHPVVVAMIVQPNEFNAFDQRHLEFALLERHQLRMVRVSFADVHKYGRRDEHTGRLYIHFPQQTSSDGDRGASDGDSAAKKAKTEGQVQQQQQQSNRATERAQGEEEVVEVSVVYFRAGYTPNDYPSQAEWDARTQLELSAAIKCPNIALHLAGTKKVQQVLAKPGTLERFISGEDATTLRKTFAALYSLDPDDYSTSEGQQQGNDSTRETQHQQKEMASVDALLAEIQEHPELYVLKPQREGGGGNHYGREAANMLAGMAPSERLAYIVQSRILPPTQPALVMRDEPVGAPQQSTTELGLFGVSVRRRGKREAGRADSDAADEDHVEDNAGVLLRTKQAESDEVGFAAGFGVLDSPWLTD